MYTTTTKHIHSMLQSPVILLGPHPRTRSLARTPRFPDQKKGGRSRSGWLVSILAAVCAALIAATITGVAVWKATECKGSLGTCEGGGGGGDGGGPGASPPAEDMPTGGGPRKAIRPASGLAAIGWRVKDETFIQLVYQDSDDNLRTSWFSSLWSNWTAPRIVPLVNKDAHQPKSGTPFAVSTLWRWSGVVCKIIPPSFPPGPPTFRLSGQRITLKPKPKTKNQHTLSRIGK